MRARATRRVRFSRRRAFVRSADVRAFSGHWGIQDTHPTLRESSMRLGILVAAAMIAASRIAHGQTQDTTSYAWLVKAAHDAVDRGEYDQNKDDREAQFKRAED